MKKFVAGTTVIPVSGQIIHDDDVAVLHNVVDSRWYTDSKRCAEFRRNLGKYFSKSHVTLTNSGSSASLVAVSSAVEKIEKDTDFRDFRYVVTTALAFPTTVAPIYQTGKIPFYVDIDPKTLTPDMDQVFELWDKLEWNIAGAIFTHMLGFPFDEQRMSKLFNFLIADCCDSIGAEFNNFPVGTFSQLMTLSFFPAHHLTSAEGGAVLTNLESLSKIADSYTQWGRSCFPANTPITTKSGIKYIQDISVGDLVFSHEGYYDAVLDVMSRKYTGKMVKIKAKGRPEISATSEHPFLVYDRSDSSIGWKEAKDLSIKDVLVGMKSNAWINLYSTLNWNYTTDTRADAKFAYLNLEPDLLRLVGYWLSQGSLASGLKGRSGYAANVYKSYRVDFSFHRDKVKIIDDVIKQMNKYFGCSGSIRTHNNSKAVTISFKSRSAYEFFGQLCGVGAENKHIPYSIMDAHPALLVHLVWGMILGDGNKSFQGYSLSSVSYELIDQAVRILKENDILTSIVVRTKDKHHSSTVNGKLIEQKHDLWTIEIYGPHAQALSERCGDDYISRSDHKILRMNDCGFSEHPIYSLSFEDVVDLDVYNFEVEKSNSYHAWGVAVHNCYCNPGQSNTCGKRFEWETEALPEGWDHKYIFDRLGYNLKMTEFQAALGNSQLSRVDEYVLMRQQNFDYYLIELDKYSEFIEFVTPLDGGFPSPFGFPIIVKETSPFTAKELIAYLEEHKVTTRRFFGGNLTRQPAFRNMPYQFAGSFSGTDYVTNNGFWIGVHPALTDEMKAYVVQVFEDFFKSKGL